MRNTIVLLALGASAAGCITTRAQAPVERPTLDVPPVPPRVIEAAPPPEPPPVELVSDLPAEKPTPPTNKPRQSATREVPRDPAKPEAAKPEIPPVEPPPSVAPSAPPLRTPATADTAAAERRVKDILARSGSMLKNIDYGKLAPELQTAYNQAKSHVERAEAALKVSDLDLAKELAEKAEKLARGLQGR